MNVTFSYGIICIGDMKHFHTLPLLCVASVVVSNAGAEEIEA